MISEKLNTNISKFLLVVIFALGFFLFYSPESKAAEEETIKAQDLKESVQTNGTTLKLEAPQEASNPNLRLVNIKNEFYESIKIVLESKDPSAEIKYKEIYLNPYQTRNNISIAKNVDYKISLYNLYDVYLGYLINTDTKTNPLISISPFLLVYEQKQKSSPTVVSTVAPKEIKSTTVSESKSPSSSQPVIINNEKHLKIANLSSAKYKVNITQSNGELIDKTWEIDDESYSPEFLDLNAKHLVVEKDYTITISNKKNNELISKKISDLSQDEHGDYVWIIGEKSEVK